jgi:multiple sugar transport system substrate-binding protein
VPVENCISHHPDLELDPASAAKELSQLPTKEPSPPMIIRQFCFLFCCAAISIFPASISRAATTVEVLHYFNVKGQLTGLAEIISEFEQSHPDVKIQLTYVPFGELVSRTLQTAAVRRPPAISCIDNPDVLRVAKANILQDISSGVAQFPLWKDIYPGPKSSVTDGSKTFGVPIGSNSLALFYNKKMLADAGIASPPKTWSELTAAAAKLTKSPVYGLAFSAVNTEECTWQWEPFLWSNGGALADLTSTQAREALQLWVDLVKNGSVSRDVVNWNQGDVANQFIGSHAAMMVMGPWMLGAVKESGLDFGVVTIPVPKEGVQPVVPLGGEVWCVLKTDKTIENAALEFIKFTQESARLTKLCLTFNYISSLQPVAKQEGEQNPALQPFVDQMDTARARPSEGGANYPAISLAARTAIQKALTGQATVEAALSEAAAKIKTIK